MKVNYVNRIKKCILVNYSSVNLPMYFENEFDQIFKLGINDIKMLDSYYEKKSSTYIFIFNEEELKISKFLNYLKAKNSIHQIIVFLDRISIEKFLLYLNSGIKGFLNTKSSPNDVKECIKKIEKKDIFINSDIIENKSIRFQKNLPDEIKINLLTKTEKKIFFLIGQGITSKEIANTTCNSIRTIQNHRQNIKEKLSVSGYNALTLLAQKYLQKIENQ